MPTTSEIIDAAKALGQQIAKHDAATRLEQAIKTLKGDTDAQRLLGQFNQLMAQMMQKEQSGRPIEVAEKRQIQAIQTQVVHNLSLRNFQMAQMDYLDLLRQVDKAMTASSPIPTSYESNESGQDEEALAGGTSGGSGASGGGMGGLSGGIFTGGM